MALITSTKVLDRRLQRRKAGLVLSVLSFLFFYNTTAAIWPCLQIFSFLCYSGRVSKGTFLFLFFPLLFLTVSFLSIMMTMWQNQILTIKVASKMQTSVRILSVRGGGKGTLRTCSQYKCCSKLNVYISLLPMWSRGNVHHAHHGEIWNVCLLTLLMSKFKGSDCTATELFHII